MCHDIAMCARCCSSACYARLHNVKPVRHHAQWASARFSLFSATSTSVTVCDTPFFLSRVLVELGQAKGRHVKSSGASENRRTEGVAVMYLTGSLKKPGMVYHYVMVEKYLTVLIMLNVANVSHPKDRCQRLHKRHPCNSPTRHAARGKRCRHATLPRG